MTKEELKALAERFKGKLIKNDDGLSGVVVGYVGSSTLLLRSVSGVTGWMANRDQIGDTRLFESIDALCTSKTMCWFVTAEDMNVKDTDDVPDPRVHVWTGPPEQPAPAPEALGHVMNPYLSRGEMVCENCAAKSNGTLSLKKCGAERRSYAWKHELNNDVLQAARNANPAPAPSVPREIYSGTRNGFHGLACGFIGK